MNTFTATVQGSLPGALWRVLAVAGAIAGALLVSSLSHVHGVPLFVPILLMGLAGLSAWRPDLGLVVLAATVPVATWVGRTWNPGVAWPEAVALAFVTGYCSRAIWRRVEAEDGLGQALFSFIVVVIASLAVRFLVLIWSIGGAAYWLQLVQLASVDYFLDSGSFRPIDAAMRLIEGMIILRAAFAVTQANPAFAPTVIRSFVCGAAAAAALNLWRVWQGALRLDEPVATFFRYLTTLRYNVHYADVNAAGSQFVLALIVAIGLAIATRGVGWMAATLLIATSLMLSGSRAAFIAGAVSLVVWAGWRLRARRTRRDVGSWAVAAGLLLAVIGTAAVGSYLLSRRNLTPSSTALSIRAEFVGTTLRMIRAHPAFGVGIGRYAEQSRTYSSPLLVEGYELTKENAHNNFLQVLGELGIAGFVTLMWVLVAALRASSHGVREGGEVAHQGMLAGVLAFILTWLAGHPLLIDEPAMMFWLVLGTAAGVGRGTALVGRGRSHTRLRRAVAVAALGVMLLVPLRARMEFASADLEHQGIGVSGWRRGDDGVLYRVAGAASTLFIPSDTGSVTIPLRSVQPGTELRVSLWLNGRRADAVRVPSETWYPLHLIVPSERDAPRFLRLELRIEDDTVLDPARLMIGRVERR
jgi:O-antigen ligase